MTYRTGWQGFAFLLLLALAVGTAARAATPESGLEARAQRVLAEHFAIDGPGAAVALLERGRVRLATARGLADIKRRRSIDHNTLFDLASVSKHITAAAVLRLVELNKLDLNAPLVEVVPEFDVAVRGRAVRVIDLLHHVSGLPDYTGDAFEGDEAEFSRLTTETHLNWINGQRALRAPGRRFEYNNSGYALLALVVERRSGQSFRQFVRSSLFGPAGMKQTEVMDQLGARFPAQAEGYSTESGSPKRSFLPSRITGDGNVFSSINDMIAWCVALRANKVLSEDSLQQMVSNGRLESGQPIDDEGVGYGLGWFVNEERGHYFHSGSWSGTATYLAHEEASDRWVIVLSNDEDSDVEAVAEALAALLD